MDLRKSALRPRVGLFALACVALAAIGSVVPGAAGQDGWTTHRDPRGFIVDVPPGWILRYDDASRKVTVQNSAASAGVIMQLVGTTQPLHSDANVSQFFSDLLYASDSRLPSESSSRLSDNVWRSKALSQGRAAEAYFTWNSTKSLSVGYLYGGWYPASVPSARLDMRKIWKSYRVALPASAAAHDDGPPMPSLRYAKFTEPFEQAFTVDLPATWKQSGGINRTPGTVGTSAAFRAETSGSVMIMMGDPRIPTYREADPGTERAGYREGDTLRFPGPKTVVGRYLDGTTFAKRYAESFGSQCRDVKVVNTQRRPDAESAPNAIFGRLNAQFEYGEADFTCIANGAMMRGYVFAGTGRRGESGVTLWWVHSLFAFLAKPELAAQAVAALNHARETYRIDPGWTARQDQAIRDQIDITRRSNEAISKIISDTYWNRAESQSRISTMRSDATRGVRIATDPYTNAPIKIDNRYSNNWMTPDGKITGSDVSAQPSAGARRIIMGP